MDDLLDELRGVGSLDSSAEFTIDLERAADRLSRFQLQLPGLYLLKLVQAAVVEGATAVHIRLSARESHLLASMPPDFELEALRAALEHPLEASSNEHLARAQQFLLATRPEKAAWCLFNGRDLWRSDGSSEPVTDYAHLALRVVRARPCGFGARLRAMLRLRTGEHATLTEGCAYCPIPVYLDGRLANAPWLHDRYLPKGNLAGVSALTLGYPARYVLAERLVMGVGHPRSSILGPPPLHRTPTVVCLGDCVHKPEALIHYGGSLLYDWRTAPEVTFDFQDRCISGEHYLFRAAVLDDRTVQANSVEVPRHQAAPYLSTVKLKGQLTPICQASLMLPIKLEGPGRLIPVRHGVAMQTQEEDLLAPGLVAVVACEDVQTDLSERTPVKDEAYQALIQQVRVQARQLLDQVLPYLGHLTSFDYSLKSYVLKRMP
ncbi:MAG: hypothetical protein AB1758_25530 [Candidatus Eremiobacterota bacterium]